MDKNNKILKAKCTYCGKEVFSLYEGQLEYNLKAHELSCPVRKKEELHGAENVPDALNKEEARK